MTKTIRFATEKGLRNSGYEDARVLSVKSFDIHDSQRMTVHCVIGDDQHTDPRRVDGEFVVHAQVFVVGSGPRLVADF